MKTNPFYPALLISALAIINPSTKASAQDVKALIDSSSYSGQLKLPLEQDFLLKTSSGHFYEVGTTIKQKNMLSSPQVKVFRNGKKYEMQIQGVERPVPVKPIEDVTETIIDGDFKGWDGNTVFNMVDGHSWQQDRPANMFSNLYRPTVVIYRTTEGYKMKIDGVDETMLVKRIK